MSEEVQAFPEEKAKQLPDPQGYRMLCAIPEVEDKFENGLLKPDSLQKIEEFSTVILFVIKMGPDCYLDKTRFQMARGAKKATLLWSALIQGPDSKFTAESFV